MKKLFLSEVVSAILVIGVFTLAFTLLGGWEKSGQERYMTTCYSVFFAILATVVAAIIAAVVSGDGFLFEFAGISAIIALFAGAGIIVGVIVDNIVGTTFIIAAVIADVIAAFFAVVVNNSVCAEEFDDDSRFSLGVEAVVIAGSLLGITFVL